MIAATRVDGTPIYINPDRILMIEGTPETMITFTDRHVFHVSEPIEEIVSRFAAYYRSIHGYTGRQLPEAELPAAGPVENIVDVDGVAR